MPNGKSGIREESVERFAEDLVYIVDEFEKKYPYGVPLRVLRSHLNLSSRFLRQGVVNNLKKDRLFRTRVLDEKGREAAITTRKPSVAINEEIASLGEECTMDNFSREYRYLVENPLEIDVPETKYRYTVFSNLPNLIMDHMQRHEDVETWNEDKLHGEEKASVSWFLKGVDPESLPREREINYSLDSKDGIVNLSVELVLRKREDCVWGVDPLDADKYLNAAMGLEEGSRFSVLLERAHKAEELAEYAADLIRDSQTKYNEDNWKRNFDVYRDFLTTDMEPEFYFDRSKKSDMIPITSDPFMVEMDKYVDSMKGGLEGDDLMSKTKKNVIKKTKTAESRYRMPIDGFLKYIEDATYDRLKAGSVE